MSINFRELASKYQTSYYVYDFNYITNQYEELKSVFRARKSLIAYAAKANSNLGVIKHLANLGAGTDCVSIGEVKQALKAGIPSYKIIFSGVGKIDGEVRQALELNILVINVKSSAELDKVEVIAKELNKIARAFIRVNPNIGPKTHPYISTGLHENKFGVDIDSTKRMYIQYKNSENLDPIGVHCHIGLQLAKLQPIKEIVKIIADLVKSLKAIKIELSFIDIDGGLRIIYKDEKLIDTYGCIRSILETMFGLDITITCEPGRFIVGNSGIFVARVLYEKINGNKRFVTVDGAMNDLVRLALYNTYHGIGILDDSQDLSDCNLVGPVCESGDLFAKNIRLPRTEHNGLVAIYSAGACEFTISSNYNTRGKVAEIAIEGGKDRLIRKGKTFEDLIALEEGFIK